MFYDNGSTPDDIAAAAGEILTEIGVAPTENGGGTSATATASSISETARVLLASPPTHPERRGSGFFPLAGGGTAHGQDVEPLSVWGAGRTDPLDLGELASTLDRESPRPETDLTSAIHGVMGAHKEALENSVREQLGAASQSATNEVHQEFEDGEGILSTSQAGLRRALILIRQDPRYLYNLTLNLT